MITASGAAGAALLAATCMLLPATHTEGSDDEQPSSLEEQRMADWDLFMQKSIVPGEDDDDDDDDDDDEDDEEEEEGEEDEDAGGAENGGGPADDAEDCTNGEGILVDDEQRDNIDQDDEDETASGEIAATTTAGTGPGPADDAEDPDQGADPYDNLPDEDEPTGCTICLINRQGPCRPFWRKFERCMKDHGDTSMSDGGDGDDDDKSGEGGDDKADDGNDGGGGGSLAEMCDKYMLPWLNCIQSYRNTYTLITNSFYQKEYVDALEDAVPEEHRGMLGKDGVWSVDDNVDLSLLNDYIEDQKKQLQAAEQVEGEGKGDDAVMSDEEVEEAINLAKAYLKEKEEGSSDGGDEKVREGKSDDEAPVDPVLIAATAKIIMRDPISGHPIDMAYVRDQDGRILGFEQFSKEKKLLRGEAVDGDDGQPTEAPSTANCGFHIQPGETASFKVFALYREDVPCPESPLEGEEEKEPPKVEEKLYFSQAIPLVFAGVADEKNNS